MEAIEAKKLSDEHFKREMQRVEDDWNGIKDRIFERVLKEALEGKTEVEFTFASLPRSLSRNDFTPIASKFELLGYQVEVLKYVSNSEPHAFILRWSK